MCDGSVVYAKVRSGSVPSLQELAEKKTQEKKAEAQRGAEAVVNQIITNEERRK